MNCTYKAQGEEDPSGHGASNFAWLIRLLYLSHLPMVSPMSCPCLFESCRLMNQGFAPIIVQPKQR
jgi:hypothetical protein